MIIQQKKKKVKEKIGRAYKEQNYSNIFLGKNRHRHHRHRRHRREREGEEEIWKNLRG